MPDDPKDSRPEQTPGEGEGTQQVGREQDAKATEKEEEDSEEGPWIPLTSSNVRSFRYNKGEETLSIIFKNGRQYDYSGVPEDVARGLETTSSPGSYVWRKIIGSYDEDKG